MQPVPCPPGYTWVASPNPGCYSATPIIVESKVWGALVEIGSALISPVGIGGVVLLGVCLVLFFRRQAIKAWYDKRNEPQTVILATKSLSELATFMSRGNNASPPSDYSVDGPAAYEGGAPNGSRLRQRNPPPPLSTAAV
jgi:hypothetical protein